MRIPDELYPRKKFPDQELQNLYSVIDAYKIERTKLISLLYELGDKIKKELEDNA